MLIHQVSNAWLRVGTWSPPVILITLQRLWRLRRPALRRAHGRQWRLRCWCYLGESRDSPWISVSAGGPCSTRTGPSSSRTCSHSLGGRRDEQNSRSRGGGLRHALLSSCSERSRASSEVGQEPTGWPPGSSPPTLWLTSWEGGSDSSVNASPR